MSCEYVVETCPQCGGDLLSFTLSSLPLFQCKVCTQCGWRWQSERGQFIRIPFEEIKTIF